MRKRKTDKKIKPVDRNLLILTLVLTIIGLVAVADASAPLAIREFSDKFFFVKQQSIRAGIGIVIFLFLTQIKYSFWEKLATPFFLLSVLTLVLVLFPGLGTKLLGAKRWLMLGPASFQPSEIAKLSLAIYLAKVTSKDKKLLAQFVPIALVVFLIMLQPDLGTALIISSIGMVQIFISGISLIYFAGAAIVSVLIGLLLILTSDYRKARLLTFIQQTQDPLGKGYHIKQVLLALGAGGLFGVGLGQSRQKYLFLPETATDSILAVLAEEIGFLGVSILIFVFFVFIYRGIMVAKKAPDKFSRILASGIVAWIGGQTFLNIGSMVAAVPLTGIPLPFISYGGSSLVMILIASGILLNISKYGKEERKRKK